MSAATFELSTDEGFVIRGNVDAPDVGRRVPAVVCIHGFKGFKDWGFWPEVVRRLSGSGFAVVRFNFSHSGIGPDGETFSEGASFESGTYSREVEDLELVVDALSSGRLPGSDLLDAKRVGLLAHSRGAVSALAMGAQRNRAVRSIALWNPVATVLWWGREERERWRREGFWEVVNTRTHQVFRMRTALLDDAEENRDQLEPLENARHLAVPLLVVVAGADESVSSDSGRRLARAVPSGLGALREIANTGHTFGAVHPPAAATPALEEAVAATLEHFERTLGGGRA